MPNVSPLPTITGQCSARVTAPTAADACKGAITATTTDPTTYTTPGTFTITWTYDDGNGNTAVQTQTVIVKDTTPPTITSCPAGVSASANANCQAAVPNVTGQVIASDNCTPAGSLSVTQSPAAGTLVGVGTTTITVTVTDLSGVSNSCATTFTVADTTPPTISCPANVTATLPPNSPATSMVVSYAAPAASDNCTVNVNCSPASGSTFPVGATEVTCTATDGANNQASCSFTVTVLYNFAGFFSPVNNLPVLNHVNAGRTVPVKFSLSGNKGLAIFAAGHPASIQIACDSSAPLGEIEGTNTPGGSSLSYDAANDQYVYNWKTESSWAGTCRQLIVKLNDGSLHMANFKFK